MTAAQANVRIWWDVTVDAYRVTSPFNRDLVDALKKQIPGSDRSYDHDSKMWTIHERQFQPLIALLGMLNIKPTVVTRQQAEAAAATAGTNVMKGKLLSEVTLEFVKFAGFDAMQKAYRHASLLNHPDRGGDPQKMSAINAAWDRMQKEVFGAS